ncbi:DUF1870 family protein [Streptomyces sp. DSM 44917]|uniref:DUF1870 family protein n=1 Tax=Streptomyces boetiae TaxID=3075541 RepID=A0ABU2L449_9ACTN|nr:DUF1870 family protein [Streptomyces sp. DSM 44917]MDT0306142.1 DUF1870 family protein [Streptomyces sp. DSM 44917]
MPTYTDPPGMPDDERMTPAEFQTVREYLGLSGPWLASYLGVSYKTIQHWQSGRFPVPDGVRLTLEELEERTAQFVDAVARSVNTRDEPGDAVVETYRSDEEYRAAHPDAEFPASWHRMVVARVAQQVPALSIVYAVREAARA